MQSWKKTGVNAVVSTLEPEEAHELDLDSEETAARQAGMDFMSLPIPDRQTPIENPEAFLRKAEQELNNGRNLVVHCRQGIGRSALVASAFLILAGWGPDQAIEAVKKARLREVPETEEQREWIRRFAKKPALSRQS